MAKPQQKVTFMDTINSPTMRHDQEGYDHLHDYQEETSSASGCNCFRLFSFKWQRNDENDSKYILNQRGEHRETWLMKKLKKAQEVSEVLAGPKWKTFIRKISGYVKNKKQKNNQFQYDPESYALNFDGGVDREEDRLLPDFSTRFAAPPVDERR